MLRGTFHYSFSYIATLSPRKYVYILLICVWNFIVVGNTITAWIMSTCQLLQSRNKELYYSSLCQSKMAVWVSHNVDVLTLVYAIKTSFHGTLPYKPISMCSAVSRHRPVVTAVCPHAVKSRLLPLNETKKSLFSKHEPGIYYEIISFKASHNGTEVNQWYEFDPLPAEECKVGTWMNAVKRVGVGYLRVRLCAARMWWKPKTANQISSRLRGC